MIMILFCLLLAAVLIIALVALIGGSALLFGISEVVVCIMMIGFVIKMILGL